ncbi:MAG: hypothetical protein DMG65_23160 [Candidatus Angelobacter sp. Gp1-AA117]|nr:MAG: hypothetical protein DMG65_23160 [Candidatus Angelobacter sp. Gp1-AA117]
MCPVCGASFRGSAACSRCGADLTIVMSLQASAWRLRRAARNAVREGNSARAHALAAKAQAIHQTPSGAHLELVTAWLQIFADQR